MATIRLCEVNDLEKLQAFSVKTFSDTFAKENDNDNFTAYVSKALSLEKLRSEMLLAGSTFFFLEEGNELVGYLKLNIAPHQSDINDVDGLEIERIYVDKAHHGKGFGKILFDFVLQKAQQHKTKYIWLGVWENNLKAIAFYKQLGFVKFAEHPFKLGSDLQSDHLMRLEL